MEEEQSGTWLVTVRLRQPDVSSDRRDGDDTELAQEEQEAHDRLDHSDLHGQVTVTVTAAVTNTTDGTEAFTATCPALLMMRPTAERAAEQKLLPFIATKMYANLLHSTDSRSDERR
jgi:hypothetical protein